MTVGLRFNLCVERLGPLSSKKRRRCMLPPSALPSTWPLCHLVHYGANKRGRRQRYVMRVLRGTQDCRAPLGMHAWDSLKLQGLAGMHAWDSCHTQSLSCGETKSVGGGGFLECAVV